jgi:hypothetical protein
MAAVAAADNLHNIPEFHGLVWFVAQSPPHPVYAPPYWKRLLSDFRVMGWVT